VILWVNKVGPYHNPHVRSSKSKIKLLFFSIKKSPLNKICWFYVWFFLNYCYLFKIKEKYEYYSLPFCQPKQRIETRFEGLGEALEGYELIKSDIKIKFKRLYSLHLFYQQSTTHSFCFINWTQNNKRHNQDLKHIIISGDTKETVLCGVPVTKKEIQRFRDAIKQDYFYELFLGTTPWLFFLCLCIFFIHLFKHLFTHY
jgi:hypothetical protein